MGLVSSAITVYAQGSYHPNIKAQPNNIYLGENGVLFFKNQKCFKKVDLLPIHEMKEQVWHDMRTQGKWYGRGVTE